MTCNITDSEEYDSVTANVIIHLAIIFMSDYPLLENQSWELLFFQELLYFYRMVVTSGKIKKSSAVENTLKIKSNHLKLLW